MQKGEIVRRRHSLEKEDVNLCFPFVEKYDELLYEEIDRYRPAGRNHRFPSPKMGDPFS